MVEATWITVVILELIHARGPDWRPPGRDIFIRSKTNADVRPKLGSVEMTIDKSHLYTRQTDLHRKLQILQCHFFSLASVFNLRHRAIPTSPVLQL